MSSPRHQLVTVQYLRGVAALLVAWFHLTNSYPWTAVRLSGTLGWLGVPVFFVISGFILPYAIWGRHQANYQRADFVDFARRRIVRIEPPYLVSVIFAAGLWYLSAMVPWFKGKPPDITIPQLLSHIAYLPGFFGYAWLQPVYWSLAYEFCFYGVLGLSYPWLIRSPLTAMSVLTTGAMLATAYGGWNAYIPLFAVGASVFLARVGVLTTREMSLAATIGLVVSAVGDWRAAIAAALTTLILHFASDWQARGFAHRALLLIGSFSYSLYITHVPIGGRVVNLGSRFVTTEGGRLVLSLLGLATCLGFAWLYWYVVEQPFQELASRRREKAPLTPPAPA